MKKLALLFAVLLFGVTAFAQRTATIDNLEGAETNLSTAMQGAKTITATCTQVGGTSDGTLTLYGSVDGTNYSFINFVNTNIGVASPKASITGADLNQITITDGLVASWIVLDDYFLYYKISGGGTTGDTTSVAISWSK